MYEWAVDVGVVVGAGDGCGADTGDEEGGVFEGEFGKFDDRVGGGGGEGD